MRKKNLTKAVETTVAPNPKEVDIWVEPKDDDTVSLKYYDYHDKEWVGGDSDGGGSTKVVTAYKIAIPYRSNLPIVYDITNDIVLINQSGSLPYLSPVTVIGNGDTLELRGTVGTKPKYYDLIKTPGKVTLVWTGVKAQPSSGTTLIKCVTNETPPIFTGALNESSIEWDIDLYNGCRVTQVKMFDSNSNTLLGTITANDPFGNVGVLEIIQ